MIKIATSQELRVRDVMSTEVLTIPFSATVEAAARLLHDARVSGAPVVGPSGRVLGVVSTKDLLNPQRSLAPDASVADVMTRVVFAVRADDALKWAIRLMVEERIHRVVVADDAGHLVGIVSAMDVLAALVPAGEPDDVSFSYVDLRS